MWCGVVWYVVWCGVVWYGVVCGVMWKVGWMVRFSVEWSGVVQCGVVWSGVVLCSLIVCLHLCSLLEETVMRCGVGCMLTA